jgi:hypothetical protein
MLALVLSGIGLLLRLCLRRMLVFLLGLRFGLHGLIMARSRASHGIRAGGGFKPLIMVG